MSKQLTISATASVLAMALFAVFASADRQAPAHNVVAHMETGATASAIAPVL